jgi:hypothetical protein
VQTILEKRASNAALNIAGHSSARFTYLVPANPPLSLQLCTLTLRYGFETPFRRVLFEELVGVEFEINSLGPPNISVDVKAMKVVESGYEFRGFVQKASKEDGTEGESIRRECFSRRNTRGSAACYARGQRP